MNELDREISDAFALLAVVLVFVFLLFSVIWQKFEELDAEPGSSDYTALERRVSRYTGQWRLLLILLLATLLVFLLTVPLSRRVIAAGIHFDRPFDTTRAGLLLVDLFVLSLAAGCVTLMCRIKSKKSRLNTKIASLKGK